MTTEPPKHPTEYIPGKKLAPFSVVMPTHAAGSIQFQTNWLNKNFKYANGSLYGLNEESDHHIQYC